MNLIDSHVLSSGMLAYGVHVASEATALLRNNVIETRGMWSYGVSASTNSNITIERSEILTHGASSHALHAQNGGVSTVSGSTILTTGNASHGLSIQNAEIRLQNTHVRTEGENAQGSSILGDSRLTVAGGFLHSVQGSAIEVSGTDGGIGSTITLTEGATVSGGNGILLSLNNDKAPVQLNLDSGAYGEGDIVFKSTPQDMVANTQMTLKNGSHWKGATNGVVRQLSLAGGSQWTMTGHSSRPIIA